MEVAMGPDEGATAVKASREGRGAGPTCSEPEPAPCRGERVWEGAKRHEKAQKMAGWAGQEKGRKDPGQIHERTEESEITSSYETCQEGLLEKM